MRKRRLGEAKQLTANHEAGKWLSLSLALYIIELFMVLSLFSETGPAFPGLYVCESGHGATGQHLQPCGHLTTNMSKIAPQGTDGM